MQNVAKYVTQHLPPLRHFLIVDRAKFLSQYFKESGSLISTVLIKKVTLFFLVFLRQVAHYLITLN